MTRLFALADLNLSRTGHKPMDVFGELWRDHDRRMAEAWDATVGTEDVILLPGDLSWARNLEEAEPDLAWIGERPRTQTAAARESRRLVVQPAQGQAGAAAGMRAAAQQFPRRREVGGGRCPGLDRAG